MVWDHLFGTYTLRRRSPLWCDCPDFYRESHKDTGGGTSVVLWAVPRAHGWRERLCAIYKPPEWEPNGVEEIQSI